MPNALCNLRSYPPPTAKWSWKIGQMKRVRFPNIITFRRHRMPIQFILDQVPRPIRMERQSAKEAHMIDPSAYQFTWPDAIKSLRSMSVCFWNNTNLNVTFTSGFDPAVMNGMRGLISYPHRFHHKPKLLLFTKEPQDLKVALEEQVDFVGGEELIPDILAGKILFERVLCTVDMMPMMSKVARTLGPLGLMPSIKTGTIITGSSEKVLEAIRLANQTVMFRVERGLSSLKIPIGPLSLEDVQLEENLRSATNQVFSLWQALPRPPGYGSKIMREIELSLSSGSISLAEPSCKVTKAFSIR